MLSEEKEFISDFKRLQQLDPEFYKFLQVHDKEALNFDLNTPFSSDEQKPLEKKNNHLLEEKVDSSHPHSLETDGSILKHRFYALLQNAQPSPSLHLLSLLIKTLKAFVQQYNKKDLSLTPLKSELKFLLKQKKQKKGISDIPSDGAHHHQESSQEQKSFSPPSASLSSDGSLQYLSDSFAMLNELVEILEKTLKKYWKIDPPPTGSVPTKISHNPTKILVLLEKFWTLLCVVFKQGQTRMEILFHAYQTSLESLSHRELLYWLAPVRPHILTAFQDCIVYLWIQLYRNKDLYGVISQKAFVVLLNHLLVLQTSSFHSYDKPKSCQSARWSLSFLMEESQQNLLDLCKKRYCILLQKISSTRKKAGHFESLESSLVQLYAAAPDSVAYRSMFTTVRQLANIVRNCMRAQSRGTSHVKKKRNPQQLQRKRIQETSKFLYHWSFIYICRLVIAVIASKPVECFPLAYPLSSILISAIKMSLNNPIYINFMLHCCDLICSLMASSDTFIPLGAMLMSLGDFLVARWRRLRPKPPMALSQQKNKVKKRQTYSNPTHVGRKIPLVVQKTTISSPPTTRTAIAKPPNLQNTLCLKASDMMLTQSLHLLWDRWICVCINYYGLLARHPSFPESTAVFMHHCLKSFMCKDSIFRDRLKRFLRLCRDTSKLIYHLRFDLDPLLMPAGLTVFCQNTIPLVQCRQALWEEKFTSITMWSPTEVESSPHQENTEEVWPALQDSCSQQSVAPSNTNVSVHPSGVSLAPFHLDSDTNSDAQTSEKSS